MEETKHKYVKRTQRDYSMPFKLAVVQEVEHTGGAYGLRSIMIWSPADKWGIVAMTNGYTNVEGKEMLPTLANAIYNAYIKEPQK